MTGADRRASYDLTGKVALVTGGASGIGEACVRALVDSGADVVVADLSGEAADRLCADLAQTARGRLLATPVDISDPLAVDALEETIEGAFSRLDLAVNSAGIGATAEPVATHDFDVWRRVLAVNLDGTLLSLRMELRLMQAHGSGSIVNIASILGHRGWAGSAAYVASKHAVVGLTKSAALENAEHGIRVNAVSPGFIETPLLKERHGEEARAEIGALHPVKRLGLPEEVAATVLWLLSDSASFVTGCSYPVEGGYFAR